MNHSCRIDFDRTDRTYRSGEPVRGELVIYTDAGESCGSVHLVHYWRSHGKGNPDRGERTLLRLHEGPLRGESPHRVPFELPAPGGPFTYHGVLLNVDHYVEAQVDIPGLFDPGLPEEFILVPGTEVDPPHPALEKVTGSKSAGARGCRIVVGALLIFFGFFSLPFGLLFMIPGLFLAFPPLTRALAGARIGEVSSSTPTRTVEPGGTARIEVRLKPRKDRSINAAVAVLRGREIVVFGKGSDRGVDIHEIYTREVALSGPRTLTGGRPAILHADFEVPEEAALTFTSKHNEVTWDVQVSVDIPTWPDWHQEHKLVVWPAAAAELPEPPAKRRRLDVDRAPPSLPGPETAAVVSAGEPTQALARETRDSAPDEAPEPAGTEPVETEPVAPTPPGGADTETAPPPGAESSDSTLTTAVRAILAEKSFGGARDPLIRELMGTRFTFELEVGGVKHTFGAGPDPTYRHGRTVDGTLAGTEIPVKVRFPADRNAELDRYRRGTVHTVTGRVADWEKLAGKPVLEA